MSLTRIAAYAHATFVAAAALLFVDLFANWHEVTVSVGGALDVKAGSSAWSGWGAVAGLLLVICLLLEVADAAGLGRDRVRMLTVTSVFGLAAAAFTLVELVSGGASVGVAGLVGVRVDSLLWPAYLALVLAVVVAVSAATRLTAEAEAEDAAPAGRLLPH